MLTLKITFPYDNQFHTIKIKWRNNKNNAKAKLNFNVMFKTAEESITAQL